MLVYFLALIIGNKTINTIEYITDLKAFILIEMVVAIIIFEKAYSKDTFKLAIHGIEILVLGAVTVFLLDLYNRKSSKIDIVFAVVVIIVKIYY